MWERACSRKRCYSHLILRLLHRFREQARSHIFDCISIHRQAMSRSSRRRILPTGVIGNDSRSTMCLGTL
ncbi:hypothetical protein DXV65_24320 [Pseudomonas fluorescens]|nr:hypothetical protein DXV65_24320 [Pseudomonas fluorescens]